MNISAPEAAEKLLKTRCEKTITFSWQIVRRMKNAIFIRRSEIQEKSIFFIVRGRGPKAEQNVDNFGLSKRG